MAGPLYLLDGYSLIYRTYFAFMRNPLFNARGKNVSVVFGFFRSLFAFFDSHEAGSFAVVLDSRTPTFRHEMYPEYKANREKAPQDLHDQVPIVEEVLEALGWPCLRQDGVEADDILASLAKQCSAEGRECRIITGDKDLLQLVDDYVKILRPEKGEYRLYNEAEVKDAWGVDPLRILDYLSLTGDSSDNIPGVAGIGPKTAVKLLTKFETLDGIYDHVSECTAGEQKKLTAGKDLAYMSRDLVRLKDDLEIPVPSEPFVWPPENGDAPGAIFAREGIGSLAKKLGVEGAEDRRAAVKTAENKAPGKSDSEAEPKTEPKEDPWAPVYRPDLGGKSTAVAVTTLRELEDLIARMADCRVYAFDSETDSPDDMAAKPVGFSLAFEMGTGFYIPLRAWGQEVLPEDGVRAILKPFLEDASRVCVGQNIKYDYKVLKRWGITLVPGFDTMIAAWLTDPQAPALNMDALAQRYLGYTPITYGDTVPKGDTFDMVPLEPAAAYAAEDADVTLRLYEVLAPRLLDLDLKKLFDTLEIPAVTILAEMELAGIDLDTKALEAYGLELKRELAEIEDKIYQECGEIFNIKSPKQLQKILFEDRKLTPIKRTKTGYSTDTSVLEALAEEDVVPQWVLQHRQLAKLKSTYVDALPKMVNPETKRLHTRFSQTGTATGRLSSRDPNLQNIPVKNQQGRRIREAFCAPEGTVFISADYAQIELVVLAALSGDEGLTEAFRSGTDVHRFTGALIFDAAPEEVTPDQRRIAKTINFGVMYGMSAFRLSRELKIPMGKAQEFIGAYFGRYQGIQSFIDKTVKEAEESGVVKTWLGRVRSVPGINSRNKTEKAGAERVAVNTPIQGSAADIVKTAMVRLDAKLKEKGLRSKLLLQIHDELLFQVPLEEVEEMTALIRAEMESVTDWEVPLRVSVESGSCWGEFH